MADDLAAAGLRRINVSLDSLSRDRFFQITRRDALPQVLAGLEALERHPQLSPVKVNCVAMRGFTEEEVIPFAELARRKPYQVRFIEFMPLDADRAWSEDRVLPGDEIRDDDRPRLPAGAGAARAARDRRASTASATASGEIGFINPVSEPFCARLQPDPADRRGQAAHLPVQHARDRPARRPCATARATTSSSR